VRFTETDFNTPSTLAGRYEASGLIDEAAVYYELDPASGWMQLRSDKLPLLLARRLKRLAADLEFVEDFEALYAEWQTKAHRQAPTGVATFGPKDARARKLVIGPHGTARP